MIRRSRTGMQVVRHVTFNLLLRVAVVTCASTPIAEGVQAAPISTKDSWAPLEEITVSARKIAEPLQSVPASVSVISSGQLADSGANTFQDIIFQTPNVSMSGGIAGVLQGQLGIRGVSSLVRNIGVESGVGIYVDGIYQGRSDNYNQELIDVAQIEVLRGPQGTLFGKNTIAGIFNITTLTPGAEMAGMAKVDFGNYGLSRAQAYLTGPILDRTLSGKLVAGHLARGGVYEHLSGNTDGDALRLTTYRASLYYTPSPSIDFVLTLDGLHDRGRPAFFQVTDLAGATSAMETTPLRLNNNRPNYLHRDNHRISLTGVIESRVGTITSISAYHHSQYDASLDDDQEQLDYLAADRWGDITKFFTQEFRFQGTHGKRLDYMVGLCYFDQEIGTDRVIRLGADLGIGGEPPLTTRGDVNTKTYATFANLDYRLTSRMKLSIGLRYSKEHKNVDFVQGDPTGIFASFNLPSLVYDDSMSSQDISPTASLSFVPVPALTLYGRFAKGFKSPAFNIDLVPSTGGLAARAEHASSYELGFKAEGFERRLRAQFAAFDIHYDDMQVSQLLGSGVTLNNAGRATIQGYEVELAGRVGSNLSLEGGYGYLDPVYDRYSNCSVPSSLGGGRTDCSGNQLIAAPKYNYRVAAQYNRAVHAGELNMRVDFHAQSPVFYEATNSARFKSDWRNVVNIRAGISSRLDYFVWIHNLLDERYVTYRDDRSGIGVLQTTAFGEPRTYGITVAVRL